MTFKRGIWAEAFVLMLNALPYLMIALLGELAIRIVAEWLELKQTATTIASALLWAYFAYKIHAQLLLPADRDKSIDEVRIVPFTVRVLGLSACAFFLGLILAFISTVLMDVEAINATYFFVTSSGVAIATIVVIRCLTALIIYTLFGTLLPAYVANRGGGIGSAFLRGISQFGWIFLRFLAGPGLLILLFALASLWVYEELGIDSKFWNTAGFFQPLSVFVWLVLYSFKPLSVALTATILSRAFIRAEGMPEQA